LGSWPSANFRTVQSARAGVRVEAGAPGRVVGSSIRRLYPTHPTPCPPGPLPDPAPCAIVNGCRPLPRRRFSWLASTRPVPTPA
jgi:hypothetical protein